MKLIEELSYYRRRLRALTLNDKGKKTFIDEADDVFSELFGINNFVSKFLDAKTPQKCNKILDRIDRKSFTKIIGSQTISLRKDGYTPKSYSVDVLDDGEDVKLSFSDLKESSDATEETAAPATPAASP